MVLGDPVTRLFDLRRGCDPQVENRWSEVKGPQQRIGHDFNVTNSVHFYLGSRAYSEMPAWNPSVAFPPP